MNDSGSPTPVKKRHVFFLSGFDPKGASYYHGVYAAEAAKRAAVGDIALTVSRRQRGEAGNTTWTIRHQRTATTAAHAGNPAEPPTDTVYEYLRWDDIVRAHWPRSLPRLLADTIFGFAVFTPCGAIRRMSEMAPATGRAGVVMGLVFPVSLLASVLVALLVGWLVTAFGAGAVVGGVVGLAVLAAGVYASNTFEKRYSPSWMSRIIAFVAKLSHGRVKEMNVRLDAMAERIAHRLRDPDIDEVLVVGYSVGSILAVSAVTRAMRLQDAHAHTSLDPETAPAPASVIPRRATLSLLTIGHCIPMLALLPRAKIYREELAEIASRPGLTWCDFSAPGDWGSFAMVDPIGECKIPVADRQPARPQLRSPRFHTLFAPAAYDLLKKNKRRLHLQYLMTGDLPGDYDYFAITAGAQTLAQRYPADAPSPADS